MASNNGKFVAYYRVQPLARANLALALMLSVPRWPRISMGAIGRSLASSPR